VANFTHLSTLVGGSFTHMGGIRMLDFVPSGAARLFSISYADGGMNGFNSSSSNGAATTLSNTSAAAGSAMFNFRAVCLEDLWGKHMAITSSPSTGHRLRSIFWPTTVPQYHLEGV
jgi:hypothetical protein